LLNTQTSDSSAQIVEAIWPLSSVVCRSEMGHKGVLPLRTFIQETLRRSRTSYSTLQVALYYLILIKPHVPKHDFTMEQPEDVHTIRALQCGRRMFLSALILASKYLQDRNYSARAWSKISGLNTQEINQNEMAFLLAVNWRLHITDAVFQRWTDIVLKYTPSHPPSPGALPSGQTDLSKSWKSIILELNPELDNIEGMSPSTSLTSLMRPVEVPPAKSFVERYDFENESNESTPTPKYYTPSIMEPSPSTVYPPSKPAPALGLLPTPRLTPQSVGFGTPAVSAASYMLSKSAMGYAMAQASAVCSAQATEKWPIQTTMSPQGFTFPRRSSLANSVSSMSSPESMISDNSTRSSRSSSISSASSLMSAPVSSKLDVQARYRYAKQCCDRQNSRTIIATVPEDFIDNGPTASPESYTGAVGKDLLELSLETPLVHHGREIDYLSRDSANDAARALQDLHNNPRSDDNPSTIPKSSRTGSKRSRPQSIDNSLQENVRDLLTSQHRPSCDRSWSDNLVRTRSSSRPISFDSVPVSVRSVSRGADGRKRVCCSTEASRSFLEPGLLARPGMWAGILN
jgi:PHO85 cyclin-5